METIERSFTCPVDCLAGVGDVFSGQYSIPSGIAIPSKPRVLDIGANCGAFTLWARMMWPGCSVHAYEPQPDVFRYLDANTADTLNVTVHNQAVGDPSIKELRRGKYNRLCSSLFNGEEQSDQTIPVQMIAPEDLPEADIVKIDTEGAETYIVEHITFVPKVMILEWHGPINRFAVEIAVAGKMRLMASRLIQLGTGIYVFAESKQ